MPKKNEKSEIAESFKNLLKKADEIAYENKKDDLIDNKNFLKKKNSVNHNISEKKDRLGIKNIRRIPEYPFSKSNKVKNEDYLKHRKELVIKLSIILNKHIHYWLQKELPKFSKIQLKKQIYNLLIKIQK